MRRLTLFATTCLLLATAPINAQTPVSAGTKPGDIATPDQPGAIALLASPAAADAEQWELRTVGERTARNVTNPTLLPFLPDPAKATGAAVIVAPGGGFFMLSMDSEGYDVARWLTRRGIAAFVLKYRTEPTPRDRAGYFAATGARMKEVVTGGRPLDTTAEALADAEAAVRLVRARAAEWHVDPARVGFVGFSAGAMTALSVGLIDDKASRPDFIAPIYPPMSARTVPADAPPMFVAIALDDPLFGAGKSLDLIDSWRKAHRPIEVHLYERGGHGFGMTGRTAAARLWIDEFTAWMMDRKLLAPPR